VARSPRVPGYHRHSSGQARITLDGKDFLLGPYGCEESKEAYRRTMAEWAERKGPFAPKADTSPLSVNDARCTPTATGKAGAEEGQSSSPWAVSSTAQPWYDLAGDCCTGALTVTFCPRRPRHAGKQNFLPAVPSKGWPQPRQTFLTRGLRRTSRAWPLHLSEQ
jgi:hypothetical protein